MNILIVRLSSLGDVIQATPLVADILAARPGAGIDWVVEEAFAPLLGRLQGLRRVIPIAQRRWRHQRWSAPVRAERRTFREQLRQQPYDAVLDVQGLIKSALVARQARLAPGGFRATYGNASELCSWERPVRWLLDRPIAMEWRLHAVQRPRLLAARALGHDAGGAARYHWRVEPLALPARSVVLVHGTARADNEWPVARWVALGQQLAAAGWRLALPQASDAEQARAGQIAAGIAASAAGAGAVQVWPRMALPALLDHLAASAGVIGLDTGLSHLAVALDLPHVQIFSQPRIARAGPPPCAHQRAVGGDAPPDVDTVWQAWRQVTAARA